MSFPTSQQTQLEMSELGWSCETRLTKQGWGDKPGFSVWFTRYDWHGKRTLVLVGSSACYHAHTPDLTKMDEATSRAAERALAAYLKYPECPPSQGADNQLVPRIPIRRDA